MFTANGRLPVIVVSDEIRATLARIDGLKASIRDKGRLLMEAGGLGPNRLQELQDEFVVDTVYHGLRLSGGTMERSVVRRVLGVAQ